jgi:hypothetical protein
MSRSEAKPCAVRGRDRRLQYRRGTPDKHLAIRRSSLGRDLLDRHRQSEYLFRALFVLSWPLPGPVLWLAASRIELDAALRVRPAAANLHRPQNEKGVGDHLAGALFVSGLSRQSTTRPTFIHSKISGTVFSRRQRCRVLREPLPILSCIRGTNSGSGVQSAKSSVDIAFSSALRRSKSVACERS